MKKAIGVLGGMGPMATCDMLQKIIDLTDAGADQEHVHVYVDCNTNIPDRTKAILDGGADPLPEMVKSGMRLQSIGADAIVIPCSTAHYFVDRLLPYLDIPIIHMVRETAKELRQKGVQRVGLLASSGTIRSGVYDQAMSAEGISVVTPSGERQADVMTVIYNGVKAANKELDISGFQAAIHELFERGAEMMVLGCTELPIAFQWYQVHARHIDPTIVLAKKAIEFAGMPIAQSRYA